MTIGLAASGPGAGLAIFRALAAVERVTSGAIGGFVSFAAITESGELRRAETQRGGTSTLFTEAERTGTDPPPEIANAPRAVLMSSGPDRPIPLAQFTPADPSAGLVSGHRLPNAIVPDGTKALNAIALSHLGEGQSAEAALLATLAAYPEADAGLILIDRTGAMAIGNSDFVNARVDRGEAVRTDATSGLTVAVIHNAIFPVGAVAPLAIETAIHAVAPLVAANGWITVAAGVELVAGPANRIHIDENARVNRIELCQKQLAAPGPQQGAALPFRSELIRDGIAVGHSVQEPYCCAQDGRLITLNNKASLQVPVWWSVPA